MEVDSKPPAPPSGDGDKVVESRFASPTQQQTESNPKSMSDTDNRTDTDSDAASPQASQSDREPHVPVAQMGSAPSNVTGTHQGQQNKATTATISAPVAAAAAAAPASDAASALTTRTTAIHGEASGTGSPDVGAPAPRSTSHPASTSRAPSAQGFRPGGAETTANASSASPVLPSQGQVNALGSSNRTSSNQFQPRASADPAVTNTNTRDVARSQPQQQPQQQPQLQHYQAKHGHLFGVLTPSTVPQAPPARDASVNSPQFRSPQLQHAEGSSWPAAPQTSTSNSSSAQAPSTQWRMPYEQGGQTHQPPNQQSHRPHHQPHHQPQRQQQEQPQQQHRSSDAGQAGPGSASDTNSSTADAQLQAEAKMIGLTMQSFSAASIRRAIRDNWQKCLTGSDYHNTFLVSLRLFLSSLALLFF